MLTYQNAQVPQLATSETFGGWLRERRRRAELTQVQLADAAGVKRESVSLWESDKAAPESQKLSKIARAVGVSDKEMNDVAGRLLGRVIHFAHVRTDKAVGVKEPSSSYGAPSWPKSVHVLASRLETRILEAGGTPDAATWARRALLNPDAYVRFFPSDRPLKSEAETLTELEFVSEGLFVAATGKRRDERSRRSPGRGKA